MSNQEYHLMHRKLLALGSVAQNSLQRLLCCLSLKIAEPIPNDKSNKSNKEAKAISEVLSKDLKTMKKISNFFTDPNAKSKIFKAPDYNALNEKI